MNKIIKISLVAALALASSAFGATVEGTATAYHYNKDGQSAKNDLALTLKVSEKFNENISANVTVVAVDGAGQDRDNQIQDNGTLTTEANVVASYANTTVKAGRQYIQSPMLYSFDWKMKPVSYQAIALINTDIKNTTVVVADVQEMAGNTDTRFSKLNGTNRAYGAMYSNNGYSAQAWYYDIDALNYTQVYLDATKTFNNVYGNNIDGAVQVISTDANNDSMAYAVKASTKVANMFDVTVALADVQDGSGAYYVGGDSMYTSMWNSFAIDEGEGVSSMISASTKVSEISVTTAYADYKDGFEANLIAGYSLTKQIDLNAVYSNTDSKKAVEFVASYSF